MGTNVTHVGTSLRAHRIARGWTLRDVASRIGVSLQTVHRWEAGTNQPALSSLSALAKLYGLTMAALIDPANAKKKARAWITSAV